MQSSGRESRGGRGRGFIVETDVDLVCGIVAGGGSRDSVEDEVKGVLSLWKYMQLKVAMNKFDLERVRNVHTRSNLEIRGTTNLLNGKDC